MVHLRYEKNDGKHFIYVQLQQKCNKKGIDIVS